MRRKWPRPRGDWDIDSFSRDETETRRWYVSTRPWCRDRDHNPVEWSRAQSGKGWKSGGAEGSGERMLQKNNGVD